MICYHCSAEAGKNEVCPFCGTDLGIFQKVIRISNFYYNDGLSKAGIHNLSGAAVSLQKSLKFNKKNTPARNLLGLVYWEMGEPVNALSEWVISVNLQPKSNRAARYLKMLKENQNRIPQIDQTTRKYNKALDYCRQNSRDMALIQLKKVLSMNPNMVKAHQLMALLYMQDGQLDKARKELRLAGRVDSDNTITLRYLKEVNRRIHEKTGKKGKEDEELLTYQAGNDTVIMPKAFREVSLGSYIPYLILGLVIGTAFSALLLVPHAKEKQNEIHQQELLEANTTISQDSSTISALQNELDEAQEKLADQQDAYAESENTQKAYETLFYAVEVYNQYDLAPAVDALIDVDSSLLGDNATAVYEELVTNAKDYYMEALYEAGIEAAGEENYADTVEYMQRVIDENKDFQSGNAAYYLGLALVNTGETDEGEEYLQYVIDEFPLGIAAQLAQSVLDGMN